MISMAIRALHIVPCLDPMTGGPARSVPALCRALQRINLEVALYTMCRSGSSTTISSPSDEPFCVRWFQPVAGSRQLPTGEFYRTILADARRFDIVHLHSLWNPVVSIAALACRRKGVPYVISPRGMLQSVALSRKRPLKRSYFRLLERRTVYGARALHFLTEAEARDSQDWINGKVPYFVIPNGADPAIAKGVAPGRFRKNYPVLENKRILLFLGRLHWSKGLELQAEALKLIIQKFPNAMWVLVGPDDGEWEKISRMVELSGLKKHVLWTGMLPIEKCLDALADADLFLLTSRHEAQSMAMNEALAVGVPIVMTGTVQFDNIIDSGAGRVVDWDANALAEAAADVLQNQESASKMRAAGRRVSVEKLAWPKISMAMAREYELILSGVKAA